MSKYSKLAYACMLCMCTGLLSLWYAAHFAWLVLVHSVSCIDFRAVQIASKRWSSSRRVYLSRRDVLQALLSLCHECVDSVICNLC